MPLFSQASNLSPRQQEGHVLRVWLCRAHVVIFTFLKPLLRYPFDRGNARNLAIILENLP